MTFSRQVAMIAIVALLAGCASRPRAFSPVVRPAPTDQMLFEAAFAVCGEQVAAGRRDSFRAGRTGSAAGGVAIGGAAAMATGASAMSGAGLLAGSAATAGLAIGFAVLAPLAIFGVSRVQRSNKEREIRNAMSGCLAEEGYIIEDWEVAAEGSGVLRSPTQADPAPAPGR